MYVLSTNYRHTAADAADSTVFCMRNPAASTSKIRINKILFTMASDATTATAVGLGYYFVRYSAADPTGGASPVRGNTNSRAATSVIADANTKAGAVLTTTSVSFETTKLLQFICANANGQNSFFNVQLGEDQDGKRFDIVLYPGQGLCMRMLLAAVAGLQHSMTIFWDEIANT